MIGETDINLEVFLPQDESQCSDKSISRIYASKRIYKTSEPEPAINEQFQLGEHI